MQSAWKHKVNKIKVRLFLIIGAFISLVNPLYSQTPDETIDLLNTLFSQHSIGTTNFSFKKISDTEIIATNSVTVNNYGPEKLTYRFNPKNAVSLKSIVSKKNVTIIFTFRENTVEWFDKYLRIEMLSKIQCSLINMSEKDIDDLLKAYKHLINSLGGNLKDEIF